MLTLMLALLLSDPFALPRWTAADIQTAAPAPALASSSRPNPLREPSFWLVVGGTAALGVWDVEKTIRINRACLGIFEENPILSFHPSRKEMYGFGALAHGAAAFLSWSLGRSRHNTPRRLRFVPQMFLATGHSIAIRRNYQVAASCTRR